MHSLSTIGVDQEVRDVGAWEHDDIFGILLEDSLSAAQLDLVSVALQE